MADLQTEGKLTPLERFFRLLSLDKKEIGQLYFYAIFQGLVALSLPLGIQAIINLVQGGVLATSWWILVVIVVAGIVTTGALQIMQMHIAENLKQRIFTRASIEFAYRLPKIRFDILNKRYLPVLKNRFYDVVTIQKGISKILLDFDSYINVVGKQNPGVIQLKAVYEQADARVLSAAGAFDPKLYSDFSQKKFDSKTYYQKLKVGIVYKTPSPFTLNADFQENDGQFLNPENSTGKNRLWN